MFCLRSLEFKGITKIAKDLDFLNSGLSESEILF
jgi:hypothetical protein